MSDGETHVCVEFHPSPAWLLLWREAPIDKSLPNRSGSTEVQHNSPFNYLP